MIVKKVPFKESEIKKQKNILSQLKRSIDQKNKTITKMNNFKEPRSIKKNGGICKRDAGYGSTKYNPNKVAKANRNLKNRFEQAESSLNSIQYKSEKKSTLSFYNESKLESKIVFQLINVSKNYTQKVLNGIDMTIKQGDRIAFIGENGSGKTTLLKIMAGLLIPCKGQLYRQPTLKISYYSQEHENLNLDNNVINEIIESCHSKINEIRCLLAALDFKKD